MIMAKSFRKTKAAATYTSEPPAASPVASEGFPTADTFTARRGPIGDIALDTGSSRLVATNCADNSVTIVDAGRLTAQGTVPVPGAPFAVVAADDRAYVGTSSTPSDGITVIDTNSRAVIAYYPLALTVTTLAVTPNGKRVIAGRAGQDRADLAIIDVTAERVGTVDIATGPDVNIDAVRVDESGRRVYAATSDSRGSRLVVVDAETAQVQGAVPFDAPIRDVALCADGPDGRAAYVLTADPVHGGAVHTVDLATNRIAPGASFGGWPTQLALSSDGNYAYIVDQDRVEVYSTLNNEILEATWFGAQPSCAEVGVDGERLYVADYAGELTALDIASTAPILYAQFVPTDMLPVQQAEELRAAV